MRGRQILAALGCSGLSDQPFGTCSQGERQRVLLARSLFVEHPLLLLDEPCAGVDLPGREALVLALTALARSTERPGQRCTSATTWRKLSPVTTHALLLRAGDVVAAGPVGGSHHRPHLGALLRPLDDGDQPGRTVDGPSRPRPGKYDCTITCNHVI